MHLKQELLEHENQMLRNKIKVLENQQAALLIERDFWVEQGRNLQNALQTWQKMYSGMFDQLGRGVVTDQHIKENLALASEQLRQPLTAVEAIRAFSASWHSATQGNYTSVKGPTYRRGSISEKNNDRN
ncbi:hypothetical protein [Acinetobacter ursingii]|uniref:hypothetical protein n=1 Tax=Acinetobacter ursingii TaxID=108980 RepID=UPI003AF414C7